MKVKLKCFDGLSKRYACDYRQPNELEVPEDGSVTDALRSLGVGDDEVKIVFVNGKFSGRGERLSEDDQVALAPATAGM